MKYVRLSYVLLLLFIFQREGPASAAPKSAGLLDRGWQALVVDHDSEAFQLFSLAYTEAVREGNTEATGRALLNMGICTYSISYSAALEYSFRALEVYKKLESENLPKGREGRARCLQLISTIKSRQGNFREAINLSREAMKGLPPQKDSTGTLGLIYTSLGSAYRKLGQADSAAIYYRLALEEHEATRNTTYLPAALVNMGDLEREARHPDESFRLYERGLQLSDSTGNRQAQVLSLIALGKWQLAFGHHTTEARGFFLKAQQIAGGLSDRSFYLNTLTRLYELSRDLEDYSKALNYREEMIAINDSIHAWDQQKIVKGLEVRFAVSEKDRQLQLLQKTQQITRLTNGLLGGGIMLVLLISVGVILFLKRINKRDRQLLAVKEELILAAEAQKELIAEQKRTREIQMQMELEFKESQLSAMTLQMLQRNELLQELKDQLANGKDSARDMKLERIIGKGLNHDKEWSDFNAYFESINKNFYTRLKAACPDISPNDRKICALIKLNMSIKEMAGILNISPDSVKTARYRLRKKLKLNTEDNLTEFILSL